MKGDLMGVVAAYDAWVKSHKSNSDRQKYPSSRDGAVVRVAYSALLQHGLTQMMIPVTMMTVVFAQDKDHEISALDQAGQNSKDKSKKREIDEIGREIIRK